MDQHFRAIGVLGVILLGVLAILVAAFRCAGDAATLMAYLGVASTAIGILGGLLNGNKSEPPKGNANEKTT